MTLLRFRDRQEAGTQLAAELASYAADAPLVLALPRGGVPVAYEVAKALSCQLDVWVVRKLGVPWQPELGLGAVAEGGVVSLNQDILDFVELSSQDLERAVEGKRAEVESRVQQFRKGRPAPDLSGRTVILVDDGIATGGTVRAAIRAIREKCPQRLVLAVPVAADATAKALETEVDRLVCLRTPQDLYSVGAWYEDFEQVSDEVVASLLERAHRARVGPGAAPDGVSAARKAT